jgi:hypothetical protein
MGAFFGFFYGSIVQTNNQLRGLIQSFLLGTSVGSIAIIADSLTGLPLLTGLTLGTSIWVGCAIALLLPKDNQLKTILKESMS